MIVADRIAVMDRGRSDADGEARRHLRTARVALGRRLHRRSDDLIEGRISAGAPFDVRLGQLRGPLRPERQSGGTVWLALRPEKIAHRPRAAEQATSMLWPARVFEIGYRGDMSIYKVRLADRSLMKVALANVRRAANPSFAIGDLVWVSWPPDAGVVLDAIVNGILADKRNVEHAASRAAVPYLWLAVFFLAPFLIVLKISLSQTAMAQPPYLPVLDCRAGWAALKEFTRQLSVDNFPAANFRLSSISCPISRACRSRQSRHSFCWRSATRSLTASRARRVVAAIAGDGGGAAVLDLVFDSDLCLDQYFTARRAAQ